MKYYLQLMANRRGHGVNGGLARSVEVESDDVPRIGDLIFLRDEAYVYHARVYECFRRIDGEDKDRGIYSKFVQERPGIRALIKKKEKVGESISIFQLDATR